MRFLGKTSNQSITDGIKLSKQCFKTFKIEADEFFEEILPKSSRLMKIIEDHKESYEQVWELSLDVFTAAYRYQPTLLDSNEMEGDYLLNYYAMKTLLKDPKYKELRSMTRRDDLASLMVTELFMEQLMEVIEEGKAKLEEALEAYEKAKKELREAYEEAKESGEIKEKTLEEVKEALKEAKDELEEIYKQNIERKVKKAIGLTLTDAKGVQDTIANWGLGSDDTYQRMPYEEKLNTLEKLRNNKKLKEIAKLAGKLTEIFLRGDKAKTKRTKSHIKGVELGDDIPKVIASEMMRLRHPVLKKQFYKSYREKRLMQHEHGGTAKLGKGPIVAMIDSSGSMSGDSEIYAKAVCMSLLEVAKKQRRAFMVIHFDSGVPSERLKVNRFTKSHPYKISEVIDMVEYFGGGGTEFEPPLKRAKNEVDEEREFSKADIIMITDGCSAISNSFKKEFLSWKAKKKVTVFSVLINLGYASDSSLKEFSDEIQILNDVQNEGSDVARRIFDTLI
jgi:uncharacterized protein with von Willebrand factor type A (vWA) domain